MNTVVLPGSEGGQGGAAARPPLDSRGRKCFGNPPVEHAWVPAVDLVEEGGIVLRAERAAGAHDPIGVQGRYVTQANKLREAARSIQGRVALLCLTIDRRMMLRGCIGPLEAYDKTSAYVRRIPWRLAQRFAGKPMSVVGFEVQDANGDGWTHYHLWMPIGDDVTLAQVRKVAEEEWRTKIDQVNKRTGEVHTRVMPIGSIHVEIAKNNSASLVYALQYIEKLGVPPPPWQREACRQFRKVRVSLGMFKLLASLGLHTPNPVRRRVAVSTRKRRPVRRLVERQVESGSKMRAFLKLGGKLRYRCTLRLPAAMLLIVAALTGVEVQTPRFVREPAKCVYTLAAGDLPKLACMVNRCDAVSEEVERWRAERLDKLSRAWEEHQYYRAERESRQVRPDGDLLSDESG